MSYMAHNYQAKVSGLDLIDKEIFNVDYDYDYA